MSTSRTVPGYGEPVTDPALLAVLNSDLLWQKRWTFVADMNRDGVVTISDVGLWIKWMFFAPGDWCILMLMNYAPSVSMFFELSQSSIYGTASAIISAITWVFVFLSWTIVSS